MHICQNSCIFQKDRANPLIIKRRKNGNNINLALLDNQLIITTEWDKTSKVVFTLYQKSRREVVPAAFLR